MYFVNHEQINQRLSFLEIIAKACRQITEQWPTEGADLVLQFSQERTLHLAIESVTDVGSLLIDAFILRDASSYEDIVDIVHGEGAYSEQLTSTLRELARLRKGLVQEYVTWDREALHPLMHVLPAALPEFAESVRAFIQKELA